MADRDRKEKVTSETPIAGAEREWTGDDRRVDADAPKGVKKDTNRDPLSGAKGAHPAGTAVGGASGAAAGAAIGAIGGPVGVLIGGAIGAFAGGWVGSEAGEKLDPTVEREYWRKTYLERGYVDKSRFDYDRDYEPAYRYGYEVRATNPDRHWDDVERDMSTNWGRFRGKSRLEWEEAKMATRDAWDRIDSRFRYDKDSSPATDNR